MPAVPPRRTWRGGTGDTFVLSVLVRGRELLGESDEVVAQLGKLGGKVGLGTGEPDALVDAAAHAVQPELAVRLGHAEQVLQAKVGVGDFGFGHVLPLARQDGEDVPVAGAEAVGLDLREEDCALADRLPVPRPCGEDQGHGRCRPFVGVARFEDDGLKADLAIRTPRVAAVGLGAAAAGSRGVEGDELAPGATVLIADTGVEARGAVRDVHEAVAVGLGQGDDTAGDGLDAGSVGGVVAALDPLGELTLGRIDTFGLDGLLVPVLSVAVPEAAVEVCLGLGRERSGLDEAFQRGDGGCRRGHDDSISVD